MMRLQLRHNLPFVALNVTYRGSSLKIPDVLVDTGSAGTVVSVDRLMEIQIVPRPEDVLRAIRGVGGREAVFLRRVDRLEVAEASVQNFEIEVGAMDYGFGIQGILGMDFLRQTGAIIDLRELTLRFESPRR